MATTTATILADPLDDLDVALELKLRVRVEIALGDLFGERPEQWGKRVLAITGGTLPSVQLDAFLADPCGGYASSFEADDPIARAELWAHTHVFRASAKARLSEYRSYHADGVSVLPCGEDCRICSKGPYDFPWSREAAIPQLPRHYGCRCTYVAWFKDMPRSR